MARKQQDDLSFADDELAAAFLNENADDLVADQGMVEAPIDTQLTEEVAAEEYTEDDWDPEDDIPGQLAVDVYETVDKLIIKARTAGIERKDLDVSISDNILTISGILNGGEDDQATRWHIQECYWGQFSRTIALPVQVKEEGVEAVLKDGVLTISFEKVNANPRIVIDVK